MTLVFTGLIATFRKKMMTTIDHVSYQGWLDDIARRWPLARTRDPETSHEAADKADTCRSETVVLDLLRKHGPLPDHGIEGWHKMRGLSSKGGDYSGARLRTARSALVRKGLVEWTGERVVLPSGRHARVWRAL